MRTAPVALAHLDDPAARAAAARAVSTLTHHDPVAGDACALWCDAIAHAVHTGELSVPDDDLLAGAGHDPSAFAGNNGWVVAALRAAWAAVRDAPSFEHGVVAAVRGGGDTDTVAAIAGALLGARFGASAIPARWRDAVHGWPGLDGAGLVELAGRVTGSRADGCGAARRTTGR